MRWFHPRKPFMHLTAKTYAEMKPSEVIDYILLVAPAEELFSLTTEDPTSTKGVFWTEDIDGHDLQKLDISDKFLINQGYIIDHTNGKRRLTEFGKQAKKAGGVFPMRRHAHEQERKETIRHYATIWTPIASIAAVVATTFWNTCHTTPPVVTPTFILQVDSAARPVVHDTIRIKIPDNHTVRHHVR